VVLHYLRTGAMSKEDLCGGEMAGQPWEVENRPHNAIEPGTRQVKEASGYFVENAVRLHAGWSVAVGVDQELPTGQSMRLGGEGHRVLVERCQALDEQWQGLQAASAANLTAGERAIGYLVTPGVFERSHHGQPMCRSWPWEWPLAYHQHPGQALGGLVSVATAKALPIGGRMQRQGTSVVSPQVFAAPPGTVYYLDLNYLDRSAPLEQDRADTPQRMRRWRQLGYSELLWIRYQG
jgi:CRISPR-associated protein Cmr3